MLTMDPSLQSTIVEQHVPLIVYYVVGATLIAFISMFVSCYSITWKGILAGWILLLLAAGGYAYIALNFATLALPLTNTKAIEHNQQEVVKWVQTDYGLTITPSEAEQLIDNAAEIKLQGDLKFGTITVPNLDANAVTTERDVNMVYIDGDWKLVEYTAQDTYKEIKKTDE